MPVSDHDDCQLPKNGGCQLGKSYCPVARDPLWPYEKEGWIEAASAMELKALSRIPDGMLPTPEFLQGVLITAQVAVEAWRIASENRGGNA